MQHSSVQWKQNSIKMCLQAATEDVDNVDNKVPVHTYLTDGSKQAGEKVGIVVGRLVLQNGSKPLQAHPSVNMSWW